MGRFIGGRFGSIVPIIPGNNATSAVYTANDQYYSRREGGWVLSGMEATGGVISEFVDPSDSKVYRAHIFTATGTFDVQSVGSLPTNVDYLVVAGGGSGGGGGQAGGGGAGGLRTNLPGVVDAASNPLTISTAFPVSTTGGDGSGSYTVTVGGGGAGDFDDAPGGNGTSSYFGPPNAPDGITATYGGGGGGLTATTAQAGGSGGGAGNGPVNETGAAGNSGGDIDSKPEGNPGGDAPGYSSAYFGGGGGGAGAAGSDGPASAPGGDGVQVTIAGPASGSNGIGALNPTTSQYHWFAGGGAGGGNNSYVATASSGGAGGGGGGSSNSNGTDGQASTGGGGAGAAYPGFRAGSGGSGVVVVRYQIAELTATQKATGGAISYYNGKTIHTFTSSGTFATNANWSATDVEYVVIGGGGSGGGKTYISGGGGAGGYRTGSTPIGVHPVSVNIQIGAGGGWTSPTLATNGTPSYFGTPITGPGGGGGGTYPSPGVGLEGGSGGGGAASSSPGAGGNSTGDTFPGTIGATPANGWGHDGGDSAAGGPAFGGGGGGGAGGLGQAGTSSDGGAGGVGIQLPSTFRDPSQVIGAPGPTSPSVTGADTSGKWYVAGGGGGSTYPSGAPVAAGGAGGGGAGGSGANGGDGAPGTGGGGGGSERDPGPDTQAARGGSGLVLIAYPS